MVATRDASCRRRHVGHHYSSQLPKFLPPDDFFFVLCRLQGDISLRAKLSSIEAKIQNFIPGKLIVVSTTRKRPPLPVLRNVSCFCVCSFCTQLVGDVPLWLGVYPKRAPRFAVSRPPLISPHYRTRGVAFHYPELAATGLSPTSPTLICLLSSPV